MGMDNPPSSTVLKRLFKTPRSWGGGSAVQGLHIYGSVVGGAGGDSSEQIELDYFTEAVEGMAVEDPWPLGGAEATAATGEASLSASPWLWMLDEPLQRDICRRGNIEACLRPQQVYIKPVPLWFDIESSKLWSALYLYCLSLCRRQSSSRSLGLEWQIDSWKKVQITALWSRSFLEQILYLQSSECWLNSMCLTHWDNCF